MLTAAQFEARENEVFAALRVLAKFRSNATADVEIDDDDSFAVLSKASHASGSFKIDYDDDPAKTKLLVRFVCKAERISPAVRLAITYSADAPAAFPFIFAKGSADYKDRASLSTQHRARVGAGLHKFMYAPDSINYYSTLMVFNDPPGFDSALDALLEHIDELDLGHQVKLIGRRMGSAVPEQLWPK